MSHGSESIVLPNDPVGALRGKIEAFHSRFPQECVNEHWFLTVADAQARVEAWRKHCNAERQHGSLGNMVPRTRDGWSGIMLLERLWDLYERDVFPLRSTDTLFNQYKDADPRTERPDGPAMRRANLKSYLAGYSDLPVVLVVGEAAGPWGMRWSGIPFTSERQLAEQTVPFQGEVSSLQKPALHLDRKSPHTSGSATIFWRVMRPWFPAFLAVDVVPFFPHVKGDLLKKASPSDSEMRRFLPILEQTSMLLQPAKTVAVGKTASEALDSLGMDHQVVHHTAHDAKKEFPAGMRAIFEGLRYQRLV